MIPESERRQGSVRSIQTPLFECRSCESTGISFKHYCTLHSQQHEILRGLQAHIHSGIDEASKVRHLNNKIKDTALEGAKLAMLADVGDRKYFATTVAYYKRVLTNHRANRSRNLTQNL